MNNESLESNLWSFELEMQALENKLMTFLATRKFVYPKFALCSTPKIKTIFSYRDIENLNKWISLLFPHVQKLVVKREQQILITGKFYYFFLFIIHMVFLILLGQKRIACQSKHLFSAPLKCQKAM